LVFKGSSDATIKHLNWQTAADTKAYFAFWGATLNAN